MIKEGAELLVHRYGAGSARVATQTRAGGEWDGPWMSVKGSRDILDEWNFPDPRKGLNSFKLAQLG